MQAEKRGSQWDVMMNIIIDSGKFLNKNDFTYSDEFLTIDFLNCKDDIHNKLQQWLSKLKEKRSRSSALSNLYRKEGNRFFHYITDITHDLAADYYTKAIFSAPKDSIELALSHANRAACFLRMLQHEEEGYFDCELALRFGYPMKKRNKLLKRKWYLAGRNKQLCRDTLREMEEMIKRRLFTEDQLNMPLFRKQYANIKDDPSTSDAGASVTAQTNVPTKVQSQNKKTIEKYADAVGRYVVAGEKIKKNEAIFSERAFSFVPVYNDYDSNAISYHCQNCAKTNCIPFPCYECVRATYCSPACLEQHKPIHRFECAGYQKNLWLKIGIAQLAFRNFIIGFFDSIAALDGSDADLSSPEQILHALIGINRSDFQYGDVLRLVTNFDKMDPNDILRYALTAQLLTIYLADCTDFFMLLPAKCKNIMPNVAKWKRLTAAILMKHMGQLVSNGHAISDIELMPQSRNDFSYHDGDIMIDDLHLVTMSSRIFTAIFPKISMLNHSCDPNIRNCFDGPMLRIHATRDIEENEEIFNCYGPNYKLMSKMDRQIALKQQYCFDCKCLRCTSNDQTYEKYYEYVCPNESCRAPIKLNFPDHQWWNNLDNDAVMDAIAPAFVCGKCQKPLLLNPHTLREFFGAVATTSNDFDFRYFRLRPATEQAIAYYMTVSKCLSKHHELKIIMSQCLLKYKMNEELFTKLAYIAMENYVITRERYGQLSLETIISITFALNILKMAKDLESKTTKHRDDIAKIRKIFDISKMEKSILILSPAMQTIFKPAFDELKATKKEETEEKHKIDEQMMSKLNLSSDSSDSDCSEDSDTID